MDVRPDLQRYVEVISEFVDGRRSAPQFKETYFALVKNDATIRDEATFDIIDGLFYEANEYFDDPDLDAAVRATNDEDLRTKAAAALSELRRA